MNKKLIILVGHKHKTSIHWQVFTKINITIKNQLGPRKTICFWNNDNKKYIHTKF